MPTPPDDAWLVVQREAAHRFCGRPYVAESLWSLRLKPSWHVEIVDRLRRTDFDPPPSVESVLLWLNRRDRPLLRDTERRIYQRFIELAFSGNRSIGQTTRPWLSKLEVQRLGRDLCFAPDAPPSMLAFEQWLGIVRFVHRTGRLR
jgi:23S rRNA (adenine-N6)-dimethyltransferase